jgi:hypothetical protein
MSRAKTTYTSSTKGTVSAVLVGDPLELLGALDEVLELDLLDQVLLIDKLGGLASRGAEQAGGSDEQIESHVDNSRRCEGQTVAGGSMRAAASSIYNYTMDPRRCTAQCAHLGCKGALTRRGSCEGAKASKRSMSLRYGQQWPVTGR